jgi:flagellar assembly protein FliH
LFTKPTTEPGKPMTDTPIRKFMFERSFEGDVGQKAPVRERRPVTLTPEQFDTLKKDSYDSGFAAGSKASSQSQAQHLNTVVTRIAEHVGHLLQQTEDERQQKETLMREAVLAVARKILPDFNRRHGLQEIEAIVAGVIGEMASEPRLVMRVNEGQFDSIDASLKSVTEKQGYTGKIVLLADAAVSADDCRIEWADGGIERNLEALWKNIGQSIAPGAPLPAATADQQPTPTEATPEGINHG